MKIVQIIRLLSMPMAILMATTVNLLPVDAMETNITRSMLRGGDFNEAKASTTQRHLDASRSIYVMAHRANTKGWLDHAIKWKANGIEVDVTKQNGKYYTWHGDVGGWEHLDVYLRYACEKAMDEGKGIAMFIFDLKYNAKDGLVASDITAIRGKVRDLLINPVNVAAGASDRNGLFAFYGVYNGKYADEMVTSMKKYGLEAHEGINYDANREIGPQTALDWKVKHNVQNFFYSSGIAMVFGTTTMWRQLKEASNLRSKYAFGIYGWTFASASSAVEAIKDYEYGADGVLGNMDQNYGWLPKYLDDYGLSTEKYKLADRESTPPFLQKRAHLWNYEH
jgi:hypothetical protein